MGRADQVSPPLTFDHAVAIWRMRNTGTAQHVIAASLGLNQGRVSEVLSGKRYPAARDASARGPAH